MNRTEIQDILDTFDLFADWDQRYQYLVELGEHLPPQPATDKVEANRVMECMSLVHIAVHSDPTHPNVLHYSGDCDTAIIKGVVALLVELFSGRTAQEIADLDVDALFTGLHLEENLSPSRHVGVYAIVNKMKTQAAEVARRQDGVKTEPPTPSNAESS